MPIPARYDYTPDGSGVTTPSYTPVSWPNTFMTWTGANGDTIPLTGDVTCRTAPAGIAVTPSPVGLGMPTYDLKNDQLPNMDGGLFRSVRATTRDITIPVLIRGVDRTSTLKLHNRLLRALNPHRGSGWITVSEGDGISRHLECRYVSGAEGSESQDGGGFTRIKYALVFRAMDPYWHSNAERQYDWHLTENAAKPFLSSANYPNFFPLRISSSSFSPDGLVEVVNDSAVDAWPVWTCSGQAEGLTLENVTTGKSFRMLDDFIIQSGQNVTIDTRPGIKSVTAADGTNLWPRMKADAALWRLEPGRNLVRVTAGGTNATTLVRLHYVPRYLSYVGG
ncbi:hypothetical protein [Streptomyces sp. NPDC045369]|uniref:phage distal tail protein n=1 Tax=Streptomyces sp. NPDC045369 TaxID=3155732 RepID=UPI00340BD71B